MPFTEPKLIITTGLNDDSVEFLLDDKNVEIYFNWPANDGEKWTFDLVLNHPDLEWSMTTTYYGKPCLKELLTDLSEKDNVGDIPPAMITELTEKVYAIMHPYYENSPTCTPSESYYGV